MQVQLKIRHRNDREKESGKRVECRGEGERQKTGGKGKIKESGGKRMLKLRGRSVGTGWGKRGERERKRVVENGE